MPPLATSVAEYGTPMMPVPGVPPAVSELEPALTVMTTELDPVFAGDAESVA